MNVNFQTLFISRFPLFFTLALCLASPVGDSPLYGQTPGEAHPFVIYDLNQDGFINGLDASAYQLEVRDQFGPLGRAVRYTYSGQTHSLDFNIDGFIDICDVIFLLAHAGEFQGSTFVPRAGGSCQIADLNEDGLIDLEDVDKLEEGFNFWRWWNLVGRFLYCPPGEPEKDAMYSMGDVNMDGTIDQDDLDMMNLLRSDGVPPLDGLFPEDYTSQFRPPSPTGVFMWLLCG